MKCETCGGPHTDHDTHAWWEVGQERLRQRGEQEASFNRRHEEPETKAETTCTVAELTRALHDWQCASKCDEPAHIRMHQPAAQKALAGDPGRVIHDAYCVWAWNRYAVPGAPDCPDWRKHEAFYRAWVVGLGIPAATQEALL